MSNHRRALLRRRLVLTYAVDLPSFDFAYWAGKKELLALRCDPERHLGANFDIRRFHDVLLAGGAFPFDVSDLVGALIGQTGEALSRSFPL